MTFPDYGVTIMGNPMVITGACALLDRSGKIFYVGPISALTEVTANPDKRLWKIYLNPADLDALKKAAEKSQHKKAS